MGKWHLSVSPSGKFDCRGPRSMVRKYTVVFESLEVDKFPSTLATQSLRSTVSHEPSRSVGK